REPARAGERLRQCLQLAPLGERYARCRERAGDGGEDRGLVELVSLHGGGQVNDRDEHTAVAVATRIDGHSGANVHRTRIGPIGPGECIMVEDERSIADPLPHPLTYIAVTRIANAGHLDLGPIRVPRGSAEVYQRSVGHRVRMLRRALRYHFELPQ